MTAAFYLLLCLPLLLSMGARELLPKALCFVICAIGILSSVKPYGSVLPFATGMTIATAALYARFRRRYA
jgi:hypothetical protein